MTCESVRDRLPDLSAGSLDDAAALVVQMHVGTCRDCADELELLRLLRRHPIPVPDGLEERILAEVARPSVGRTPFQRGGRRAAWVSRAPLAASIALAFLAGSFWFVSNRAPVTIALDNDDDPTLEYATAILDPFPGWPSSEAHLAGGVVLEHLTDAELEIVLTELEW